MDGFAEPEERHRCREWAWTRAARDRQIRIDLYTLPRVKHMASGDASVAQGAQLCALWWPRGGVGRGSGREAGREAAYYAHSGVTVSSSRN